MIGRVTGIVKPIRRTQDFVFLEMPEGDDVFIHKSVLAAYGRPVVVGALVDCQVVHVPNRGLRATEIYSATPPHQIPPQPWRPAFIKWFDFPRGFGFVVLADQNEDAFLHTSVLQRSSFRFGDTIEGLPVEVQVCRTIGKTRLRVDAIRHKGPHA